MTLEVKQMVIKSTVLEGEAEPEHQRIPSNERQEIREELIAEVRKLLTEMLGDRRER